MEQERTVFCIKHDIPCDVCCACADERETERYDTGYRRGWEDAMKDTWEKAIEIVKEYSAKLPIDFERQGGLYAQGMHAGIDLCIEALGAARDKKREE